MDFWSGKAILGANNNCFSDKNDCGYDTADSECMTLCKVIRIIDEKSSVDLLRKTGMSTYYNNFVVIFTLFAGTKQYNYDFYKIFIKTKYIHPK